MRFLIHGVAMYKRGGGSRHLQGLVDALGRLGDENKYLLCLNERFEFSTPYANVDVHPVEIKSPLHRLWWDQATLPRLAREWDADVIVALFIFGMFHSFVPQVMMQRNALYYCDRYFRQLGELSRLEVKIRRQMALLTMRASRIIVTPSAAMRELILCQHEGLSPERFRVLPHGYDVGQLQRDSLPVEIKRRLEKSDGFPVVLYVSHLGRHKGHEIAVKAMRHLRRQGSSARLYLTIEREDWPDGFDRLTEQIQSWDLTQDVVNLGRVPEGALSELYQSADLFFFPSLCESYGFPMVEAMGYGLPIVASDTAVNREMCGNAALYYSPFDAVAAAEQLATLLRSPKERQSLQEANVYQFRHSHLGWVEYSRRFVALLEEASK